MKKTNLTQHKKFMIRTKSHLAIVVTLILLTSTSVNAQSAQKPIPVIATETQNKDFFDKVEALGTLRSRENVQLSSSVTEVITEISFNDNQRVKKGDVLVVMDTSEEKAELAEQQAINNEAQRQINRLTPLVAKRAASESSLDQSRQELASGKAIIDGINARINQRIIKAPFDGVLGLRNISVGTLVQPGSVITSIDDDRVMKLDFSVPEIYLSSLKTGVVIQATSAAYPNKVFTGEIASLDSRIDPITRSIQARAHIDNSEGLLKPGLLMNVELQKDPRVSILIPEEALIANGSDNFVFVVESKDGEKVAAKRKIQLGARQFGEAEIRSGLNEGELIVTHGILKIKTGTPLKITAIEKNNESLAALLKSTDEVGAN